MHPCLGRIFEIIISKTWGCAHNESCGVGKICSKYLHRYIARRLHTPRLHTPRFRANQRGNRSKGDTVGVSKKTGPDTMGATIQDRRVPGGIQGLSRCSTEPRCGFSCLSIVRRGAVQILVDDLHTVCKNRTAPYPHRSK